MDSEPPDETTEPNLPAPPAAAKMARLVQQARKHRRTLYAGKYLSTFGFNMITPGAIMLSSKPFYIIAAAAIGGILTGGIGICIEVYGQKKRDKAIKELTREDNVRLVRLLIENMDVRLTTDAMRPALIALLPRLRARDAHLLNSNHHHILNRVLSRKTLIEDREIMALRLAILKAYEQVGSKEDLPTVERLAAGEGYAKRRANIREAAQACLPYLKVRSEQQESRQTLLRASGATADSGENLLRPAQATGATGSGQLLRAAISETSE